MDHKMFWQSVFNGRRGGRENPGAVWSASWRRPSSAHDAISRDKDLHNSLRVNQGQAKRARARPIHRTHHSPEQNSPGCPIAPSKTEPCEYVTVAALESLEGPKDQRSLRRTHRGRSLTSSWRRRDRNPQPLPLPLRRKTSLPVRSHAYMTDILLVPWLSH